MNMNTLQSKSALLKASAVSLVTAILALVILILPAEYNIDPTGIGAELGLTVFNQAPQVEKTASPAGKHAIEVTVPVGRGIEYKLHMEQYQTVKYQWSTDGDAIYVDLHGEPQGDTSGYFESYTIATVGEMNGQFTAPFTGSHGWYWRNRSDKDIKITLSIEGEFVVEGLKN